jgi:hypothetical protein
MPLESYSENIGNIVIHDTPTTVKFDGLDILLLPWICDENRDRAFDEISNSDATGLHGSS